MLTIVVVLFLSGCSSVSSSEAAGKSSEEKGYSVLDVASVLIGSPFIISSYDYIDATLDLYSSNIYNYQNESFNRLIWSKILDVSFNSEPVSCFAGERDMFLILR